MKHIYIILLSFLISIGSMAQSNSTADAPLSISKQGSFAVGGTVLKHPGEYNNSQFIGWGKAVEQGQSYHADHAVVEYQLPVNAYALPLVFIHGYGQSARCWQTTPDGREGFNTLMLRRGFGTYLVDLPGRGRARRTTAQMELKPLADEQLWFDIFRIGEWSRYNQGVQFPNDSASLDQFFRQMTPDISTHSMEPVLSSIEALFNTIGKGILITHSAGGFPGWMAGIHTTNVRAIVSYEPGGYVFPEKELPSPMPSLTGTLSGTGIPMEDFMKLTKISIILYFGDYISEDVTDKLGSENWRVRLQMGRKFVETINKYGGDAALVELPKIGIYGNTHFMMSDLNNVVIADQLAKWIKEKGLTTF